MENQNEATCVVLSREELFDLYGSWFGNTATPADMRTRRSFLKIFQQTYYKLF